MVDTTGRSKAALKRKILDNGY